MPSLHVDIYLIDEFFGQELTLLKPPTPETRLAEALCASSKTTSGPPCKELHQPASRSSLVHPDIQSTSFFKILKLRSRILNKSLDAILALPAELPTSAPAGEFSNIL